MYLQLSFLSHIYWEKIRYFNLLTYMVFVGYLWLNHMNHRNHFTQEAILLQSRKFNNLDLDINAPTCGP